MKCRFSITHALFVAALVISASCGKDYSNINTSADPSKLAGLFSELKPEPQSISVPAGAVASITATGGTVMHFNASSFKDASGKVITSGTVTVKVTEMYKPGDMIANRASTMSNGKVLKSGGQINITATINGSTVYANKYGVEFPQQGPSSAPMNLFYGNTNNVYSVTTWADGGNTSQNGTIAYGTTFVGGEHRYIFDSCTHFGWTNCDQFYSADSPTTSVSVTVPDNTYTPSNTQLYLVLPDIKSVMSNVEPDPGTGSADYIAKTNTFNLISEGNINIVPIGMNYKFIVLTKTTKGYYYYETSGKVTKEMKLKATMVPKTKDEIKTLLAAL
jgi:hypothetical protein